MNPIKYLLNEYQTADKNQTKMKEKKFKPINQV